MALPAALGVRDGVAFRRACPEARRQAAPARPYTHHEGGGLTALWRRTARDVAGLLARGDVTPGEVVDAAITRITETASAINAVVLTRFDAAREEAKGAHAAPLFGLPVLIKDMVDVAGLPTTMGDPDAEDPRPTSDILVRSIVARGGIILGKTNVPLLGLGADTVNPLFGLTRNPWNLSLSTAGSSGGAAAALAAGAAWLAHGSDLGGSIRGPCAMCGVVGLRPSPGRIAQGGAGTARNPIELQSQNGPMARNVRDCALFMDAMAAGAHAEDPLSVDLPAGGFLVAAEAAALPLRIAYAPDLGGAAVVEPEVRLVLDGALTRIAASGVTVVAASPDFAGVADAAYDLRRFSTRLRWDEAKVARLAPYLPPVLRETHEAAMTLTLDEVLHAEERHRRLVAECRDFMLDVDLLAIPAASRAAYPHSAPTLPGETTVVAGQVLRHWAEAALPAYAITLSFLPALTILAGFTDDGRPVGLQLVGRARGERALFCHGAALEDVLGLAGSIPIDPNDRAMPGADR